jgi:hypothetical protein
MNISDKAMRYNEVRIINTYTYQYILFAFIFEKKIGLHLFLNDFGG